MSISKIVTSAMLPRSHWFFLLVLPGLLGSLPALGQPARSFELRYFSPDKKANGETDFKGATAVFTTEQRVEFLKQYAEAAKKQFDDPGLNTVVVTDDEVAETLKKIKPQPRPEIRQHQALTVWKYLGYRAGQHRERQRQLARWTDEQGVERTQGHLKVGQKADPLAWRFPAQAWRFSVSWRAKVPKHQETQFVLSDRGRVLAATVGFGSSGRLFYTTARYNLYVDDRLVADYVPIERAILEQLAYNKGFSSLGQVNTFGVQSQGEVELDDLLGVGYSRTGREHYPFATGTFLDETFDDKPDIAGWASPGYDDRQWATGQLPLAHGSERYAEEDLYLRREVQVGPFDRAFLNVETLDPGGEVWVNGQRVAVLPDRYPGRLDVTGYLKANASNLIAVKVNHFFLTEKVGELMPHSLLDLSIGWFAGQMSLDLLGAAHVRSAYAHALPLTGKNVRLKTQVTLAHPAPFAARPKSGCSPGIPPSRPKPWPRRPSRSISATA